jgi:hypothetical protein
MREPITNDDIVLEVLLQVREERGSTVDVALLREIYEIQRRHQFERDRDPVLIGIRRAVVAETERLASAEKDEIL